MKLRLLSAVLTACAALAVSPTQLISDDSTVTTSTMLRVLDLDDDGVDDTVDVASIWRVVRGKRVFSSRMVESI